MSKIFVTGDRSLPAEVGVMPALVMIARELAKGPVTLVSGELPGFEQSVWTAAQMIGMNVELFDPPFPFGDWESRATAAKTWPVDRVLFFHADPHSSRMLPPLLEVFGDACEIVSPELMFA